MSVVVKKESRGETVSAKVSKTTLRRLSAIAKRKDRNISYVVNQILEKYFENN